jgi:DNA-binding transcriptional regulator YdaS (Cro superfamily)
MKLKDWLTSRDMTASDFAELVGISQGAISKIVRGVVWPEADTISAIERATDGEVQAADILSTYQQARTDAAV